MVVSFRIRISKMMGCALPVCCETLRWWGLSLVTFMTCVCVCSPCEEGSTGNPVLFSFSSFCARSQSLHVVFLVCFVFLIRDCPQINLIHSTFETHGDETSSLWYN